MIYNLGRVVPLFKGNYDAATTYGFLDVVYYDNSSFVALDTTTGNLPTDTTHWLPVALKGTTQNPTPAQMQQIISEVETYMHSTDFVYDPDYTHIDVINNLTSTSTTNALSANQGKVLNETIDGVSHSVSDLSTTVSNLVVDNLTTNDGTKALSAKQGKILNETIDDVSHSVYDLTNRVSNLVVDNLTTNDGTKALSAKQGKIIYDNLGKVVNSTNIVPSYTSGIIHTDGTFEQFGSYSYYAPIELQPLQRIVINYGNQIYLGNNVAVVYKCNSSGTWIETIVAGTSTYDVVSYTNNTSETIYIGICCYTSQMKYSLYEYVDGVSESELNNVETSINNSINTLSNKTNNGIDVQNITQDIVSSLVSNRYINYSNGVIIQPSLTTNPIGYYTIPYSILQNCYSIRTYLDGDSSLPAAIAFYSDETTINNTTYLKSASIQSKNTTGDWFEAKVPSNAKVCLLTSYHRTGFSPIMLVIKKQGVIISELIEANAKYSDYSETLIGTITMGTGTTGNTTLSEKVYPGDIIKVVSNVSNPIQIGSYNYGDDICGRAIKGNSSLYIQVMKEAKTLYVYQSPASSGTIEFYKCKPSELYNNSWLFTPMYMSTYNYSYNLPVFSIGKSCLFNDSGIYLVDSIARASVIIKGYCPNLTISSLDTENYDFYIFTTNEYSDGTLNTTSSNWVNSYNGYALSNKGCSITLRKKSGGTFTESDLQYFSISLNKPYINFEPSPSDIENLVDTKTSKFNTIGSINNILSIRNPYYYHFQPNAFIKDGNGNNAVPSQSAEDITIAARLGFDSIEANVQATSDGHFICMHGSAGTFGDTVYSLDNTDISSTLINTKTLDWIKTNVRFNSYYDKWKVAPLSLEEFCDCCKVNGIGIFAGTNNQNAIDICLRKLGTDNIMLYNAGTDKRNTFKGVMFYWNNTASTSVDTIINTANSYGMPFMYGLGPALLTALVNNNQLETLATQMHNLGYTIASTAVYDTESNTQNAFEAGVDYSCSGHQVNQFEPNYAVYDINDSTQFGGTSTIENGVATMTINDTITCGTSDVLSLGKGMLTLRFNGTIVVNFGSVGNYNRTITSDGSKDIILSDYYFMRNTNLTITANTSTTISKLIYKISKC